MTSFGTSFYKEKEQIRLYLNFNGGSAYLQKNKLNHKINTEYRTVRHGLVKQAVLKIYTSSKCS